MLEGISGSVQSKAYPIISVMFGSQVLLHRIWMSLLQTQVVSHVL